MFKQKIIRLHIDEIIGSDKSVLKTHLEDGYRVVLATKLSDDCIEYILEENMGEQSIIFASGKPALLSYEGKTYKIVED